MIKEYTKQTIIICFLLQRVVLSGRAQEQQVWQRHCDKCRREASIINTLLSELKKALHWSPTISKEQRRVICYILWNMVYVEGSTANFGDSNDYPMDVASFFINRYEVSRDEWYVTMGENPSNQHRRNYPADRANWLNAQRFTKKVFQLSSLPFRLPLEAEWEYVVRGELKTKNSIYADSNNTEQIAQFREKYYNTHASKETRTKKPNELGLYDVNGNIYEWCMDWYDRKVPFTEDIAPIIGEEDTHKVLHRGSYYTFGKYCKATSRYGTNSQ